MRRRARTAAPLSPARDRARRARRSSGRGTTSGNPSAAPTALSGHAAILGRRWPAQNTSPVRITHAPTRARPLRAAASGPRPPSAASAAAVDGEHEPAGRRHPVRDARDERLGDALGIEAGIDRADHVGEYIGAGKPALERRLQAAGAARKVPARGRRRLSCSTATGARLPTCPGQSALRPVEWRIPLSPSIHRKYTTLTASESGRDPRSARSADPGSGSGSESRIASVPGSRIGGSRHPGMPRIAATRGIIVVSTSPNEAAETMTMLDRMRRHKDWLKWSLAIVVLAFILLYIPSFLGARTPPATTTSSRRSRAARSRSAGSAAPTSSRCRRTGRSTAATSTSAC